MGVNRQKIFDHILGGNERSTVDRILKIKEDQIAWKGAYIWKNGCRYPYPVLIKLLIPKDTVTTAYDEPFYEKYAKHRCSRAKVLGFYSYYTGKKLKNVFSAHSFHTAMKIYFLDHYVFPESFSRLEIVCGHGIHYFNAKESALIYLDDECNYIQAKRRRNAFVLPTMTTF